MITDILKNVF